MVSIIVWYIMVIIEYGILGYSMQSWSPQCTSIKGRMWSLLDGIWGVLEGGWRVLVEEVVIAGCLLDILGLPKRQTQGLLDYWLVDLTRGWNVVSRIRQVLPMPADIALQPCWSR